MEKLILIKYGELTTKKDNRGYFVKTLLRNIEQRLDGLEYQIKKDNSRMYIYTNNLEEVIKRLKKIFGIHEFVIAYLEENNDIEQIKNSCLEVLKNKEFTSFKVETKRSLKTYPIPSMEISRNVGAHILKNLNDKTVDVNNPEVLLNIEVREEGVFIYFEKFDGLKGYPVGTLGKALVMLSGGIDSPVAAYLSEKRGIKVDYIYFESPPHTSDEAKNKVITLAKKVCEYGANGKIYVVKFTKIQEEILKNCRRDYLITIMRRMMYRITETLANKNNYLAIINGENVGQVASQTLTSMKAINSVVSIPVLKPLCMFDKLEIISIAEKIDTYKTSILPYEDCCTIFVPTHPVINPSIEVCLEEEQKLNIEELIKDALENIEIIKLDEEEKCEYL